MPTQSHVREGSIHHLADPRVQDEVAVDFPETAIATQGEETMDEVGKSALPEALADTPMDEAEEDRADHASPPQAPMDTPVEEVDEPADLILGAPSAGFYCAHRYLHPLVGGAAWSLA